MQYIDSSLDDFSSECSITPHRFSLEHERHLLDSSSPRVCILPLPDADDPFGYAVIRLHSISRDGEMDYEHISFHLSYDLAIESAHFHGGVNAL